MAVTPSLKQAPRGPPSDADQARVLGHADFASRPEPSTGTPAPPESTDPAPDPAFGARRPIPGGTFGPGVSIYSQAVLARNLLPRCPAADLFGRKGRAWLAAQPLHLDEAHALAALLRQLDFAGDEFRRLDADLARVALDRPDVRRLMTTPGVDMAVAVSLGRRSATSSQAFIVCWNRSILPQVVGWFGLEFFWTMPSRRSSASKALRPPVPPDSRVVNTIPLSVSVEAGAPCRAIAAWKVSTTRGPVTRGWAVTDRA
jgi:hypothetical protein